jgi:hypothetical protein
MNFSLIVVIGITRRERRKNLHIKSYKAKLEQLRSAILTHHDQAA